MKELYYVYSTTLSRALRKRHLVFPSACSRQRAKLHEGFSHETGDGGLTLVDALQNGIHHFHPTLPEFGIAVAASETGS